MGSLKGVTTDFIGGKYEGGIKVILESEEDVNVFQCHWFADYQDKICFESAENGGRGGGGCSAVLQKVSAARNQNMIAFGIIDRDVLLADKKLDIFWETDDDKFHQAKPYGDYIHVLRRWELENYLLKPEALTAVLAHRVLRTPAPTVNAKTLLEHEDDLVDFTALTTFLIAKQQKIPETKFGQDLTGQKLRNKIEEYLGRKLAGTGYKDLADDIEKIKAFAENEQVQGSRWNKLNRAVDGKNALNRVCGFLSISHEIESLLPWEEIRGCLADKIASLGLVDNELKNVVKQFHDKTLSL